MSQYSVLTARLLNELKTLDKVVAKAQSQVHKARSTHDDDFYQAAALSLQNYYMGIERIFEEIAKQMERSLPQGLSSHRELLEQMGLEISQIRPAVLSPPAIAQVNEYRAFRHVVIHRYGFELYPERVGELVDRLASCHRLLREDIEKFCQFLFKLEDSL
jgi:hypothetical protein